MKLKPIPLTSKGDIISSRLFTLVLEDIDKWLPWENKGIKVDGTYLNQLRFADDIVLLSKNADDRIDALTSTPGVKEGGLKINYTK